MLRRVSIFVLLAILIYGTDAKYKKYVYILENPEYQEMLRWFAPENMLTNYNNILAHADNGVKSSFDCGRDLLIVVEAIARRETWALMMLDASSKPPPSGIFRGNFGDLGQYDECLAVHNSSINDIHGLHCIYSISVSYGDTTLPVKPTLSICLPSTCSPGDIVTYFNATTNSWLKQLKDLHVKIASATCSPADRPVWDLPFVVCLSILVGLIIFLFTCTVIEVNHKLPIDGHYQHGLTETLALFSLRKSAASILSMKVKKGTLPAIDGIRCLSIAAIVLFHQYNNVPKDVLVNSLEFLESTQSWKSLYISIGVFAVDTFFTISGFLMTYLFLKQMPKQKWFNVPMYYLHRYLRLTPAVLVMMVFTVIFIPKVGSGARWDTQLDSYFYSCRTKWWPALLYLQNFVDKKNLCLPGLWYLAVDMQLFWISPLILYPLYKKPKFGLILLVAILLSSTIFSASVIGIRKLPVMSHKHVANATTRMEILKNINESPFHRAGPWLVGILFGYEVAMHDRQLSIWTTGTAWLVTIASFAFRIFGKRSLVDPEYEYNVVWETFFSVISRPLWGFGICWIIYTSIKNQAGFLSSILSLRIFHPFARLSYGMYIVHSVFMAIDSAVIRTPQYFSEYHLWRSFLYTLIVSAALAFLLNLLFESPIIVLEKILTRPAKPQSPTNLKSAEDEGLGHQLSTELSTINHSIAKTNDTGYEPELRNLSLT